MLGPPIGKVEPGATLDDEAMRETVKKIDRVHEKTQSDYGGDHRRVVDLVRASCIFETAADLTAGIEALDERALLRVLRAKDRFNHPRDGCAGRVSRASAGGRAGAAMGRFSCRHALYRAGTEISSST